MDCAAAVDKERRRLSVFCALRIDGDCIGVLDVDFGDLADRRDACRADIRLCADGKLLATQIDVQRLRRIHVRDCRTDIAHPCAGGDQILAARDGGILCKDIAAVGSADVGVHIGSVMCRIVRDGGSEIGRGLRARRIAGRCVDIAALSARRVKRNVLDALRCGRRRKTLGDGRLAREVALAARIRRVAELFREGVERRADEIFVRRFLRLRIEADVVRQHSDLAVCRRFLDGGRAAVDRRRRRRVMAVAHGRIAAELFDLKVARLAESLFYDRRAFSLHRSAGDASLIETVAKAEEAVRARHVDEAAAAAEDFHTADGNDVLPALLLRCDSIVPRRAVLERELHIVFDVEAGPLRIGARHLDVHDAARKTFPIGTVLHEEVDAAELPLRHAVAVRVDIVAEPVRFGRRETDADAPLRAHAAVRGEIALDDGAVRASAGRHAGCIFRDIEIDHAGILRDEFTVGANRRPCIADRLDRATADVDGRGDGADSLVRPAVLLLVALCQDVDESVDRDVRLSARHAVHRLDDGDVRLAVFIVGTHREDFVLKIATAVPDMNLAAAVGIDGRRLGTALRLRVDGDRACVLNVQLCAVADRSDSNRTDVRFRMEGEIFAAQIDVHRGLYIGIGDRRAEHREPCTGLDQVLAGRDRCILRKDIGSIFLPHTGVRIFGIMPRFADDGRSECGLCLFGHDRCTVNAFARRRIKRDVLDALARRRRRQPLGDFHLAREVLFAVLAGPVPKFVRQRTECLLHEFHIRRRR